MFFVGWVGQTVWVGMFVTIFGTRQGVGIGESCQKNKNERLGEMGLLVDTALWKHNNDGDSRSIPIDRQHSMQYTQGNTQGTHTGNTHREHTHTHETHTGNAHMHEGQLEKTTIDIELGLLLSFPEFREGRETNRTLVGV